MKQSQETQHVYIHTCTQPHPQHIHVSFLGCPEDSRPAILVSGVQLTASNDKSFHCIGSAPHGCQEEGRCRIIVRCLLVTAPAKVIIVSYSEGLTLWTTHHVHVYTNFMLFKDCTNDLQMHIVRAYLVMRNLIICTWLDLAA